VEEPGYEQVIALVPSHTPAQVPMPLQAMRVPCGAPITGTQVPGIAVASQASH
jgi:hypothetical protein